ncbi:response regulator transcription factor [Streptomyces sp. NPDC095613]|uniref:response regulator transcription factor n=1 Tax=Streptomyces sp. NPDC095613 TaxID=3155540 RepID=UPI00331C73F8
MLVDADLGATAGPAGAPSAPGPAAGLNGAAVIGATQAAPGGPFAGHGTGPLGGPGAGPGGSRGAGYGPGPVVGHRAAYGTGPAAASYGAGHATGQAGGQLPAAAGGPVVGGPVGGGPVVGGPVRMPVARAVPDGGEQALVDGISLVVGVRSAQPSVRSVVLAEKDDPRRAALALQAGASGWVAKDCSLQRLLTVVRGVLRDETHLPPALLTGVLRELTAARKHRTDSERLVESLTPREREVLRCMVAGLGRKAVAERLFLSPHTVRTHMQNVLGKLGVHSTLAAVALARRAGVGPAEAPEQPLRSVP